jgi:hypothetical protein
MPAGNKERHRTGRIGWLRAAPNHKLFLSDSVMSDTDLFLRDS